MNKLAVLFLVLTFNLFAQKKNGFRPDENDSLYVKAIKEYIVYHELHKDRFVLPNKDENSFYLNWNSQLSDLPNNINGYNIIFVYPLNNREIYKVNNNRLVILEILNLTFENGQFYINIEERETFYQKKKVVFTQLGMWTTSYFNFENGKMVFKETKMNGLYMPRYKNRK